MDPKSDEPPRYNEVNPPSNQQQFVAQSTSGYVQQTAQPVVANAVNYGPDPMTMTCFNCRRPITTTTTESPNLVCCFLFGFWALCCPGCQDVEHRCPICNVVLGTYKP